MFIRYIIVAEIQRRLKGTRQERNGDYSQLINAGKYLYPGDTLKSEITKTVFSILLVHLNMEVSKGIRV